MSCLRRTSWPWLVPVKSRGSCPSPSRLLRCSLDTWANLCRWKRPSKASRIFFVVSFVCTYCSQMRQYSPGLLSWFFSFIHTMFFFFNRRVWFTSRAGLLHGGANWGGRLEGRETCWGTFVNKSLLNVLGVGWMERRSTWFVMSHSKCNCIFVNGHPESSI